jgi:hypothetical protein
MQEKKSQIETFSVFERLKSHYKLKNDTALARFLGYKPHSISMMISRQTTPFERIISKCDDFDLNWIFYGQEKKSSYFSQNENIFEKTEEIKSEYENTDTLYKHLLEENKFLKEEIKHKNYIIEQLHEAIGLYRNGSIIVVNAKESK